MNDERLLEMLESALGAERDGYHFYASAADRSEDSGAKELFRHLAEEENRHFEALQKEYASILQGTGWDASVVLGDRWVPEQSAGIFSDEFRRRIRGRHLEMSALSIGLLLEKTSESFYREASGKEKDPSIRDFLTQLAEWESGHYRMLAREDESLRDLYWSENRFSPLL